MGEKESRPPTCTSGGAALTSLREGRRDAAFLRELEAPAIVAQHAKTSQRGGVGPAARRLVESSTSALWYL